MKPPIIKTGYIYCDKETGHPLENKSKGLYIKSEKPSPLQIAAYASGVHKKDVSIRKVVVTQAENILAKPIKKT